jgi:hypothetical protein
MTTLGPLNSLADQQNNIALRKAQLKHDRLENILVGGVVAVAVLLIAAVIYGCFFFKAHMEAKTFNKLTGANVSAWDAMWVQLRVDIPVKDGK